MRGLERAVIQAVVSMLLAGILVPAAVYLVPAVRSPHVGAYVLVGVPIAVFGLVRAVWPHDGHR